MQKIIPDLKIEIGSEVKTRSGVSAKTGNSYEIHSQDAWLFLPHLPHPLHFSISCDQKEQAKPVGTFWLVPFTAVQIGKYDDIELRFNAADLVPDELKSTSFKDDRKTAAA